MMNTLSEFKQTKGQVLLCPPGVAATVHLSIQRIIELYYLRSDANVLLQLISVTVCLVSRMLDHLSEPGRSAAIT